jgi:hypothetical protein
MSALIELQYFPPVTYFSILLKHKNVWIEQLENYQKGSYRNRCHIATANGLLRLSVPLEKGKNNQTTIKDVKIHNDTNWQTQHWRAIKSAYGNAPYFEYYADELLPFFEKKYDYLFDWNLDLLTCVMELFMMPNTLQFTAEYQVNPDKNITDFRDIISPKKANNERFKQIPYTQLFTEKHGFIPELSILDILFCKGTEAILVIHKSIV